MAKIIISDFERDVEEIIKDLRGAVENARKYAEAIDVEVTTYDFIESAKEKLDKLIEEYFAFGSSPSSEKCLVLLQRLSGITRDLAFMIPTATGADELYYAAIDGMGMFIDDLRECMSESDHRELRERFEKLSEIPWEEKNATEVKHELDKIEDIAYDSVRRKRGGRHR